MLEEWPSQESAIISKLDIAFYCEPNIDRASIAVISDNAVNDTAALNYFEVHIGPVLFFRCLNQLSGPVSISSGNDY